MVMELLMYDDHIMLHLMVAHGGHAVGNDVDRTVMLMTERC